MLLGELHALALALELCFELGENLGDVLHFAS